MAIARLLLSLGVPDVTLCDRSGAIFEGRSNLNQEKVDIAGITNRRLRKGTLAEVIAGTDVFIGVSAPDCVTATMVRSMNPAPLIFAMSNPTPEIMPELAVQAGAAVVGTGRSDFPNQINNVLAFPGILRGTLDVRARDINDAMKIAAAKAIAGLVSEEELTPAYIIPSPLDKAVAPAVAAAVAQAARDSGVATL